MRRPNPWIVGPALMAGIAAGIIGWFVTDVSCRQEVDGVVVSCPGWSITVSLVAFLGTTLGIMVLLVLVYRSLAEHAEREGS